VPNYFLCLTIDSSADFWFTVDPNKDLEGFCPKNITIRVGFLNFDSPDSAGETG
jgi:hypothetical protein